MALTVIQNIANFTKNYQEDSDRLREISSEMIKATGNLLRTAVDSSKDGYNSSTPATPKDERAKERVRHI